MQGTVCEMFLNEKISEYIWIVHSHHETHSICILKGRLW